MSDETHDLIGLTADIVSAHVANNSVHTSEVPSLIVTVHRALAELSTSSSPPVEEAKPQPATTARKSLSSTTHIISMIDGKRYKMLRRHISLHGYTPESYRQTFGLAKDYPMVAQDYAEQRRALAQKIGLGRKAKAKAPAANVPQPSVETSAQDTTGAKRPRRTLKPAFGAAVAAAKKHLGRD